MHPSQSYNLHYQHKIRHLYSQQKTIKRIYDTCTVSRRLSQQDMVPVQSTEDCQEKIHYLYSQEDKTIRYLYSQQKTVKRSYDTCTVNRRLSRGDIKQVLSTISIILSIQKNYIKHVRYWDN